MTIEHMKDIGTKLVIAVACHCPDYPIYIPFDLEGEEWILGWTDEPVLPGMETGIYIRNKETDTVRMFDNIPTFLYTIQEEGIDWDLLAERVTIGIRSVAALSAKRMETIDEVLGDDFSVNALANQRAIEKDMFSKNDEITAEVLHEWLTKKSSPTEEAPEPFSLTVVEDDDD